MRPDFYQWLLNQELGFIQFLYQIYEGSLGNVKLSVIAEPVNPEPSPEPPTPQEEAAFKRHLDKLYPNAPHERPQDRSSDSFRKGSPSD